MRTCIVTVVTAAVPAFAPAAVAATPSNIAAAAAVPPTEPNALGTTDGDRDRPPAPRETA